MYSLSPASYARFRSIQIVHSIAAPFWRFAGRTVASIRSRINNCLKAWVAGSSHPPMRRVGFDYAGGAEQDASWTPLG
jgi:hypothetical protein